MGFGTELQGRESHEALIRLQDAEIRLLENMKKCLSHRIKVDRDYAHALSTIVAIAQRFDNTEFISPIFQSWNSIIKETENLIQTIRTNTDKLCAKTLEKLVQLINEKKASRKFYTDEKHRLESELQQLQEESQRHKVDYERVVYKVRQDRTKYEELLLKGKPGGKFDEAKSKYYRSSMKLHKVHNDYVIKLLEVGIHQKNYLKNTLPGLLDFQQGTQESLVEQCKEVLMEYAECTDTSSEEYSKCHREIHRSIQSISPTTEYKEFVQTHRSDALDVPKLDFDINLLEDYKGSLLANEIAVDELTIEAAQHSLTSYGDKLNSCKQWKEHKEKELQVLESELSKIATSTEIDENLKNEINTKKRTAQILKREINELRCNEQKYQTLFETLNEPIVRAGDENLPAGLELQALGTDGIDTKDKSDTGSVSSQGRSGLGLSAAGLTSKFGALKTTVGAAFKNLKKQGASTPPKPPSKDFIQETETSSQDKRNGTADSFKSTGRSSDNYQQVSQDNYEIQETDHAEEMTTQPNRRLDEEDWFHGVLPREEVQRLLNNDGDYLVRESKNKRTGEIQHVLSVMWHGHKHFIIQSSEEHGGGWRFEGQSFPTIQELIIHQHKSGLPVTNKSQAILSTAILREQWELRNDDITLGAKIGNGNFGDVYRGVYKPKGLEVAVKTCRETLSEDQKKKFLQEGRILKQYDHPNIVKFIGIAAQRNPVMIVMEYVSGGALLNFLRKHGSNQQVKQLVKMCEDAAAGMAYLESKNCIHRDLAARNCLVGKNNTVKISDFGMSREEEEYTVSDGLKQIPIKWTAPEALNYGKYTTICDVWSFGILMWEIFSFGGTPYPGLTNSQARDKIDMGYRMPAPDGTPDMLYKLMLQCWEYEPEKRPHFDEIYRELQNIRPKV